MTIVQGFLSEWSRISDLQLFIFVLTCLNSTTQWSVLQFPRLTVMHQSVCKIRYRWMSLMWIKYIISSFYDLCPMLSTACIMFLPCPSRCPPDIWPIPTSALAQHAGHRPPMVAESQHAVGASESITVPTWTRPEAGKSIPVQKWYSLQGWQVH